MVTRYVVATAVKSCFVHACIFFTRKVPTSVHFGPTDSACMMLTAYVLATAVHDLTRTQVAVINGPETGKIGTILRVVRESGTVLVDGVRLKERCGVTLGLPRPLLAASLSPFSTAVTYDCAGVSLWH